MRVSRDERGGDGALATTAKRAPRRRLALGGGAALLAGGLAGAAMGETVFRDRTVILFVGDSITEGGRQPGDDFNHNMGQDYAYMLAGSLGARWPERELTFLNRGHSGDSVVDLAGRWRSDVLALRPDLLSLLVGVNDAVYRPGEGLDTFARVYDGLLTETRSALPGARIVLGEPFLLPVGAQAAGYRERFEAVEARQAVVADLAAKHGSPLIRYQAAFDQACRRAPADHWSWDGVHPTYAGHWLMAETWLKTVEAAWPAA